MFKAYWSGIIAIVGIYLYKKKIPQQTLKTVSSVVKYLAARYLPECSVVIFADVVIKDIRYREISFLTGKYKGSSILIECPDKALDTSMDVTVNGSKIYYDRDLFPAVVFRKPLPVVKVGKIEYSDVSNLDVLLVEERKEIFFD